MRKLGDRNWPLIHVCRFKNREITSFVSTAKNCGEQITVALKRVFAARNKDRLRDKIALRQLIGRPLAALEIDVAENIEAVERLAVAASGKIAVTVVKAGAAFVKSRKLTGEIVDLLAFEAAGV